MKKVFISLIILFIFVFIYSAAVNSNDNKRITGNDSYVNVNNDLNSNSSNKYSSGFTNKYGTPTTVCHHPGCDSYIASSGDTNCCYIHSNKCLECGCYIDEDAMYCVDCISKAADSNRNSYYHSCSASGCDKEGIYAIEGLNGTNEYYCYEHYSKLMNNMNEIFGN